MNKTIVVFANGGTMATTQTALWQYDYGQILVIQGVQLPTSYEVQFCNTGDDTTITSIGDANGVVIPDQFLQSGETIYAYIYLHTGNADGETEYKITIPVMNRAEPTDIEPTPQQESTIGQLIDALNSGVEAAEAAASHAPKIVEDYWYVWDADAGEYVNTDVQAAGVDGTDGKDGNNAWTVDAQYVRVVSGVVQAQTSHLVGPAGATVKINDIVFISDGRFCEVESTNAVTTRLSLVGDLHGADGQDGTDGRDGVGVPAGGTTGQVLKKKSNTDYDAEWADESGGGGGTSNYNDLSNKPQINSVTLSGNKSLADLGIAAASDIPTVPSAYTSTPADLGVASAGSSTKWAKGDHVHDFNSDFVTALLQIASKVAYIDGNGQTYYDALESALLHRTLSSISAVYTQSGTVYPDTSLDSLKTDLVVTATYSDSSTQTVPAADYTLSGTLTAGTSTITVSYGGKTDTFTVNVSVRYVSVENGAVSVSDGSESASTTRARTDYIPCSNRVFSIDAKINTSEVVSYAARYYDAQQNYIGHSNSVSMNPQPDHNGGYYLIDGWPVGDGTVYTDSTTLTGTCAFVRFLLRTTAGTETITNVSGTVTVDGLVYTISYS
jgi:hypothetical protein